MDGKLYTFNEYLEIFCQLIFNEFKYHETLEIDGEIRTNVHVYEHIFGSSTFRIRYSGVSMRTPRNIASKWIDSHFRPKNGDEVMQIIEFARQNVNIDNVKLYIEFIKISTDYGLRSNHHLAYNLLNMHHRYPNVEFRSFAIEYQNFHYQNKTESIEVILEKFEEHIKKISNSRISELWWSWLDFTGEYINYVEWFPREALDDLLMVKNKGQYQPDYTTYVQ